MAYARDVRHDPADGVLRDRRPARRRGDDDQRALPVTVVTLYHAPDCGLCERALEVVQSARADLAFDLELVDVSTDGRLEESYRELLPVVEIDGERAFTYFVDAEALRERVASVR